MPLVKETAAIALAAGILAYGVNHYMPAGGKAEPTPAGSASRQAAAEPPRAGAGGSARPTDPVKDAVSKAYVPPAAEPKPDLAPAPAQAGGQPAPQADPVPGTVASIDTKALPDVPSTQAPSTPTPAPPARAEAPDPRWSPTPHPEIIAKADAAFDNGDIAGTRLWLEEALAQGDADAAFRLAETYDPACLAKWKVIGIASDVDRARALYERAMNGGVAEAATRVAALGR